MSNSMTQQQLTLFEHLGNGLKVEYRVVAQHENVLQSGHDVAHRFAAHFQRSRDDIDFLFLQVVVLVGYLHTSKRA